MYLLTYLLRLQSHQVHTNMLTIIQLRSMKQKHRKYTQIYLCTVKWAQC